MEERSKFLFFIFSALITHTYTHVDIQTRTIHALLFSKEKTKITEEEFNIEQRKKSKTVQERKEKEGEKRNE